MESNTLFIQHAIILQHLTPMDVVELFHSQGFSEIPADMGPVFQEAGLLTAQQVTEIKDSLDNPATQQQLAEASSQIVELPLSGGRAICVELPDVPATEVDTEEDTETATETPQDKEEGTLADKETVEQDTVAAVSPTYQNTRIDLAETMRTSAADLPPGATSPPEEEEETGESVSEEQAEKQELGDFKNFSDSIDLGSFSEDSEESVSEESAEEAEQEESFASFQNSFDLSSISEEEKEEEEQQNLEDSFQYDLFEAEEGDYEEEELDSQQEHEQEEPDSQQELDSQQEHEQEEPDSQQELDSQQEHEQEEEEEHQETKFSKEQQQEEEEDFDLVSLGETIRADRDEHPEIFSSTEEEDVSEDKSQDADELDESIDLSSTDAPLGESLDFSGELGDSLDLSEVSLGESIDLSDLAEEKAPVSTATATAPEEGEEEEELIESIDISEPENLGDSIDLSLENEKLGEAIDFSQVSQNLGDSIDLSSPMEKMDPLPPFGEEPVIEEGQAIFSSTEEESSAQQQVLDQDSILYQSEKEQSHESSEHDLQVIKRAVEMKKMSVADLQRCMSEKQRLSKEGKNLSLTDISLQLNLLDNREISSLLDEAKTMVGEEPPAKAQVEAPQEKEETPVADFREGQVLLDRYRVAGKLGSGGMGAVYKVEHMLLEHNKFFALKVMHPSIASNENNYKRFVREVEVMMGIMHKNIIPIRDFGKLPGDVPYLTMDFSKGTTLEQILKENPICEEEWALKITRQILEGLTGAHHIGIIHRDLKPANILVEKTEDGEDFVRIVDFGLAKLAEEQATEGLTCGAVGTPHYMSPEQAGGEAVDERTDIYAVGVILYQMLTGKLLFDGKTLRQLLMKQMFEEPIPPREINPEIPEALERIMLKSIAKDLSKRYAKAKEFLEALERYISPDEADQKMESFMDYISSITQEGILPPSEEEYQQEATTAPSEEEASEDVTDFESDPSGEFSLEESTTDAEESSLSDSSITQGPLLEPMEEEAPVSEAPAAAEETSLLEDEPLTPTEEKSKKAKKAKKAKPKKKKSWFRRALVALILLLPIAGGILLYPVEFNLLVQQHLPPSFHVIQAPEIEHPLLEKARPYVDDLVAKVFPSSEDGKTIDSSQVAQMFEKSATNIKKFHDDRMDPTHGFVVQDQKKHRKRMENFVQARIAGKEKNYSEAVKRFKDYLLSYPQALYGEEINQLLIGLDKIEKQIDKYRNKEKKEMFDKGLKLFAEEKYQEAKKLIENSGIRSVEALVALGTIYQQAKQHNQAIEFFQQAIQKTVATSKQDLPKLVAIQKKLGASYQANDQLSLAIQTYQHAVENIKKANLFEENLKLLRTVGLLVYQNFEDKQAAVPYLKLYKKHGGLDPQVDEILFRFADYTPMDWTKSWQYRITTLRGKKFEVKYEVVEVKKDRYFLKIYAVDQGKVNNKIDEVWYREGDFFIKQTVRNNNKNRVLKYPVKLNSSWTDRSGTKQYTYEVVGISERVETLAGTFSNCIRVERRQKYLPDVVTHIYYAPGVGEIKYKTMKDKRLVLKKELFSYQK